MVVVVRWVLDREMAGGLHLTVLVTWGVVLYLIGGVVLVGFWWGYVDDMVVMWGCVVVVYI